MRAEENTDEELYVSDIIENDETVENEEEHNSDSTCLSNRAENKINYLLANARSLSNKFDSLVDKFRELDLEFAMINETWLKNDRDTEAAIKDIKDNENLEIIKKNRQSRGGGVAIIFDNTRMNLKSYAIPGNKFELICAVGRTNELSKKIVVFSLYIPPRQKVETTKKMMDCIAGCIETLKCDLRDPYIVIGGDFNGRSIDAIEDFEDIVQSKTGPTRQGSTLDIVCDNLSAEYQLSEPLATENDEFSDHMTIFGTANVPKLHDYTTETFETYKYTKEGESLFGKMLNDYDWNSILGRDPSDTAANFERILSNMHEECFPVKSCTIRSCDPPWFTKKLRRMIRNRKRIFKRQGRSALWRRKKKETEEEEMRLKAEFFENVKKKILETGNSKAYFASANMLQAGGREKRWKIRSMFPKATDSEIAEKAAVFFNRISQLFEPLKNPTQEEIAILPKKIPPMPHEISAALKSCKKPKSRIKGDIDRRLVSKFSDMLAQPLYIIYEQVYSTLHWPRLWATETVNLIPKCSAPDNLSQLRNLSCTPLFSKVLEGFTLKSLKNTVKLSESQFGGLKGAGVDHFLVETFDEIMQSLEDNRASVNLMSIDFEKAFNRMSHSSCLDALSTLGASDEDIQLVGAFLRGRTMSVKVGSSFSVPRAVPGGSPQGSILGIFLFCATTDFFNRINADPVTEVTSPQVADNNTGGSLSVSLSDEEYFTAEEDISSECEFRFLRNNPVNVLNDTDVSVRFTQAEIEQELGVPERWTNRPCAVKSYIDDLNIIEKIRHSDAVFTLSNQKRLIKAHAPQSEAFFNNISAEASAIGMKVNDRKTQIVCISASNESDVRSFIDPKESRIESTDCLKILGFWFSRRPGVSEQVKVMQSKFRSRLWLLWRLKNSGMSTCDLLFMYKTVIRPVLDFCAPTYHPMLTEQQTLVLERLQKCAFRLIYGSEVSYLDALSISGTDSLEDRRKIQLENFAVRASNNPRFKDKWFPLNNNEYTCQLRNRPKYQEMNYKTSRLGNSPLFEMRRILNRLNCESDRINDK